MNEEEIRAKKKTNSKKIPESLLSTYHRWVYEKKTTESVESLREWILQESKSEQWQMRLCMVYRLIQTIILIVKGAIVSVTMLIKDHFSQTLKPSTNCVRCVKANTGSGPVSSSRSLKCPRNGTLSVSRSCVFVAWSQDTWDKHVEGADPTALTIVLRHTTDCCTLKIELLTKTQIYINMIFLCQCLTRMLQNFSP